MDTANESRTSASPDVCTATSGADATADDLVLISPPPARFVVDELVAATLAAVLCSESTHDAIRKTPAAFAALTYVGEQDDGQGGFVELRNCDCGSTLAVAVTDDGDHGAEGYVESRHDARGWSL